VNVLNPAFDYLRAAGAKGEPHFTAGLKSGHEHARIKSIDGLRALKSEAAIPGVAALFKDDNADAVRAAAAEFLKSHGLKSEDVLVGALDSPHVKVRLEALRVLGEIRSGKPLARIAKLYRDDKDPLVHRKAFDYLVRLGIKAEKELTEALDDADKEIRALAIRALGDARSEGSIGRLVDFLAELDPVLKAAARDALVRIGPKALEAVNRAVDAGKIKKPQAEALLALFHQEEVERMLDRHLTEDGQSGFYEGQFREIEVFGKGRAVPVLLRIVQEPGYRFRFSERSERVRDYDLKMRELAVMALGELGDARAAEALKAALGEVAAPRFTDSIHEELLVALHKLGEKAPFEEFAKKAGADAEAGLKGDAKDDACSLLFSVGLILNRVGRRDEARDAYLRIVKAVEDHKLGPTEANTIPATLYNLACLAALKGEKPKAVEWLGKAVRAGFRDRQWIRMDKDLDSLREDPGYQALLKDDKLFERPGD
jgi:HEAT repeat protein